PVGSTALVRRGEMVGPSQGKAAQEAAAPDDARAVPAQPRRESNAQSAFNAPSARRIAAQCRSDGTQSLPPPSGSRREGASPPFLAAGSRIAPTVREGK